MNLSLGAYLPIDRRLALSRGKQLPVNSLGAALFADISGFTPLTAALANELGRQRGAEELTRHLNRIHGALIEQVHQYHGSIVGFSGDAVTCWFDQSNSPGGGGPSCADLATTCALAMQKTMSELAAVRTPSGARFPLSIKVAVTYGAAHRYEIGAPEIQVIDTLAGSILDRLSSSEEQARQGEVVVDDQLMVQLGDQAIISESRAQRGKTRISILAGLHRHAEPFPWPQVPELSPEIAQEWLLSPVFERLQRGEGDYLSELRPAVALFVRFTGLDYDHDDAAGDKLDTYMRWVQEVVAGLEGYVIELTIGDKGSHFHASFGSLMAHEDDALRAMTAALELQRPPAELDFIGATQMGISQGLMRTGAYGGATRRAYGVQGNPVNIAARLMSWARPGRILVTQNIAATTGEVADFEELGAISFKGLNRPLMTLIARRRARRSAVALSSKASSRPIVGRKAELDRMAKQLQDLQSGCGGSIVIEGEAGIGKSRLMEAFVDQTRSMHLETLVGAASAIEQATAYYAWRPIFLELLKLDESDAPALFVEVITAQLTQHPDLLDRLPLLEDILPLGLADNKLTAAMSGEVRAENTQGLLVQLLAASRPEKEPLVLVLDDAHWLDSSSWALLDRVRRDRELLLSVIVTRPMTANGAGVSLPDEYRRLLEAPSTELYRLQMMSSDEVQELVRQRLGVGHLPKPVADLVLRRAEGHPFFSEEIALALRDAGLVRIEDGEAVLANGGKLDQVDFPDTIQAVIASRIDRLDPGQELTLKVASVIGRTFLLRTLREIYPVPSDQPHLADYLETLDRLDITPLEAREPELTYLFKHAITQEVAYNLLLHIQRRQLHRATAAWIEKNYSDDLPRHYPLLAYHWLEADDIPRTIDYLDKAGEQALRTYANREAVEFLTKVLDLFGGMAIVNFQHRHSNRLKRARWLRQLGEAHLGLGHLTDSRAALSKMLSLLERPAPVTRAGLFAGLVRQSIVQVAHRLRPRYFLGRASGEEEQALLEAARAYQHLAEIYYFANERAATINAGLNVLNLSERASPSPELARAYANMVVIAGLVPWHAAAEAYGRWALETAEDIGDQSALAWAHLLVGTYKVGLGQWQLAEEMANQAIDICRHLGDRRLLGLSLGLLAIVPIYRGDFESSRRLYVEWFKIASDADNIQHQAFGLFGQAENILPDGRSDEAARLTKQGLELLIEKAERSVENRTAEIRGYGLLALARYRTGDVTGALEAAEEAMAIVGQLSAPTRVTLLEGLSGVTEVYLRLWESEALRTASVPSELKAPAKAASKVMKQYARVFAIGRPRAHLWQGLYDWLDGRRQRAKVEWQKSLVAARQLNMPCDRALAHLEIGRHLSGPDGDAHLVRAGHEFEAIGANYYLTIASRTIVSNNT